ncbi:hypothetical protein [Bordetella genomosp. 13]|uniref:hypothetical protein n=1 Tax=Bordetella genomosp. 13 TaxID=463040 RepID=UPI0011A53609|nr:hypothetical protein [Bordetella genomosp. 13]
MAIRIHDKHGTRTVETGDWRQSNLGFAVSARHVPEGFVGPEQPARRVQESLDLEAALNNSDASREQIMAKIRDILGNPSRRFR